ncbi:hypothetical protein AWU82_28525 [Pseudomonas glycinae]|uniref:Uncharacterized protein n=1 Tax=Pseudomonas glycinae TaxID=1785145 RepID=A0ABN5FM56_9PSED|nr:hypothetical protein AWU82_28525 [Pseudomonas glycinae]
MDFELFTGGNCWRRRTAGVGINGESATPGLLWSGKRSCCGSFLMDWWQLDADTGVYLVRPSARFNTATTTAFKDWIE